MSKENAVQVVAKVALLLERLAEDGETTAARLAELVGEPRSTVYRLLSSLQQLEMVETGSTRGTYRLGLKLFRLGSTVVARFDERQAALPVMERIHEETGETVFLCIRRGPEAVCIERLDGRRVQSLALRLGGSLPLHAGAAPRVLLAYEPRETWEEYVAARSLERFTPSTPTTRRALFAKLEEVGRLGYSVSDEDVTVGIAALGAPIFDFSGALRAAISISGIRSAILGEDVDRMVGLVLSGAREISAALGYDGRVVRVADA
jgi:DNA-binding IclR family transcriptional regulator